MTDRRESGRRISDPVPGSKRHPDYQSARKCTDESLTLVGLIERLQALEDGVAAERVIRAAAAFFGVHGMPF